MSHSVTIQTRTVTSGSPSSINTGFCRTWPGLLKLTQVVLGVVALVLMYLTIRDDSRFYYKDHYPLFFLAMVVTFLITTFILVLSYTCSFTTETIISKTSFEVLYHAAGFALLLISSVLVLTRSYNREYEKPAAIVALVNSVLYLLSTIFALRVTRGL